MKNYTAIIFGLAIIGAAWLLGDAYLDRAKPTRTVSVTGLGSKDFTSDLIVWEGQFNRFSPDLETAYEQLNRDKQLVLAYLTSKGIPESSIVVNSVQTSERSDNKYENGNFVGSIFRGYNLSQMVRIESKEVATVENVSREVTELLNQGVAFQSFAPRYYYTGLADLKVEMIAKATEDARLRAEKIAEGGGSRLGDLISARMGVFQITGQNSGEDYSWGGSYNTVDKNKTASITMKLDYELE